MRYFAIADVEHSPALLLFRIAMLIAHFGLLSGLSLLPVLLLILVVPRPAIAMPVGVICSSLFLCCLLIDTQVFHLYRFHINLGVLNLLFGGAAAETFVFPRTMYAQAAVIAFGVITLCAAFCAVAWRYVRREYGSRVPSRIAAGILGLSMLSFHSVHAWADALARKEFVEQTEALPLRYALTAKRTLRRWGVDVRSNDAMQVSSDEGTGLTYPLRPLVCETSRSAPNIVFIVVDSWRFDAMNAQVTPNVHAFAQHAARFDNHFSGGNATRIGVFSLFYSIPGTYWHRVLAEQQRPVFLEELLRRDYALAVLRSAPLYSPEFDRTVFAGLENLRMRSDGKRPAEWDRDLTNDFKKFLDQRQTQRPFFAFLFYDSPHSFDLPDGYPSPFQPSGPQVNYLALHEMKDPVPFLNRYLNSVHYVDGLIGEVLATLRQRGLMENSVIVITGDHGQEFDDSKGRYWGHGSNFTRYQTGVPFVLYAPDLSASVQTHRTSHFDVAPTLLQRYFGCISPMSEYSVGQPLFSQGGREALLMSEYADFAIVQPDLVGVVRRHGMDIVNTENTELKGATLPADVIARALEQKSRFLGIKRRDQE